MSNDIILTEEQEDRLRDTEAFTNYRYNIGCVEPVFNECLKLAGDMGLLTDKARWLIKPDNYIEWQDKPSEENRYLVEYLSNHKYVQGIQFKIAINHKLQYVVVHCNVGRPWQYSEALGTMDEAKDYCQKLLDRYLSSKVKI